MEILFLGGSRFIGKHAVIEAVDRGHTVTLFNRGTQPLPISGVRHIAGDRNHDLERLAGERFDAVIDTSAYVPRQVESAARTLAGSVGTYLFISTISVYADQNTPHLDEDARLSELSDPATEEVTGETYGGLKVLCERALESNFPGKRVTVRPGVVVGPEDPTDRFTYWPVRAARGGEVLAPVGPALSMQWIDGRDLAAFLIHLLETGAQGTFNAVSQPDRFTLGDLLDVSRETAESDATFTWVDESFLLENEVRPFRDLPLWLAGDSLNFARVDSRRAYDAGLAIRGIRETVVDTLGWFAGEGGRQLQAGLDESRERELLELWHRSGRAAAQGSSAAGRG
jgi:2'-hydroxyisoflavone reductase